MEGSGGASIQSFVSSVLNNASASRQFGDAGLSFAPTDSMQGEIKAPSTFQNYDCLMFTCSTQGATMVYMYLTALYVSHSVRAHAGKQGVISQSFAYAVSTFPLSQSELNSAARWAPS